MSKKRDLYTFVQILGKYWLVFKISVNIVDYEVWGTMQVRVYQTKVRDVDDLKRRLIEVWDSLEY